MWRERSVFAFAAFVNSFALLGILPFKWDSKIYKFRMVTFTPLRYFFFYRMGLTWFYTGFLCIRLLQFTVIQPRGIEPDKLKLLGCWTITYVMVTLATVNIVTRTPELVRAMNQFYTLNKRFSTDGDMPFHSSDIVAFNIVGIRATMAFLYVPLNAHSTRNQRLESVVNKKINGYFISFMISGIVNTILLVIVFAERPTEVYYMSSVLGKYGRHPLVTALFFIHEIFQTLTSWGGSLFFVMYTISYLTVMSAWLAKLR